MSGAWQDRYWSVPAALSYARKKEMFADVVFKRANSPCLYAHKLVMSVWSPHFADLTRQSNKQSALVICFTEDVDVMESVLEYLYSPNLSDPFYTRMPIMKLIQALDITERLCIRQVHLRCLNSLQRRKVDPTNVIRMFDYGLRKNLETVVKKCLKVLAIEGISPDSLDTDISFTTVETLLRIDRIALGSEANLLRLVLSWLSHPYNMCYRSEILSLIDLLSIEWNEYQHLWKKFPEFFPDSELSSILLAVARQDASLFPDWYKPRISSTAEKNCNECVVARKRLKIPSGHHLNFPRELKQIVQSFDFKNTEKARLMRVELNVGPADIPESEFKVKFCKCLSGEWRECRLDCTNRMNKYTILFHHQPLKLNEKDSLNLRFFFSRGLSESDIKFVMPNVVERQILNKRFKEGLVKMEVKSSKLAFYCRDQKDPKFLVSSLFFSFCEDHSTYLVRKSIKPKIGEFMIRKHNLVTPKTELMAISKIKKEEMWID